MARIMERRMIRRFRKSNAPGPVTRKDALACRPVKHSGVSEEILDGGLVQVSYPLKPRPWIAAMARRLGSGVDRPVVKKLQLDEMGSRAWGLIDGRRTVGGIIREFSDVFRLHPREAEASVTLFIRELGRRGIIGLKPGIPSDAGSRR